MVVQVVIFASCWMRLVKGWLDHDQLLNVVYVLLVLSSLFLFLIVLFGVFWLKLYFVCSLVSILTIGCERKIKCRRFVLNVVVVDCLTSAPGTKAVNYQNK